MCALPDDAVEALPGGAPLPPPAAPEALPLLIHGPAVDGAPERPRRLRLFIISSCFYPRVGGAERQGLELAHWLRARRMPVVVLTMADPRRREASSLTPVPIVRIPYPPVRIIGPLVAYLRGVRAFWRLARRRRGSAVVQIQSLDQFTLALGLAALVLRIPYVIRIAGAYEMNLGYLSRHGGPRRWLARRLLRRAGGLIALNPEIEERLRFLGARPEIILRLPNAIPDRYFSLRREEGMRNLNLGRPAVLSLGRLSRFKGCHTLLKAWRLVQESHPEARLHLVGDGPLRPEIEALISEWGLAGCVTLWGTQRSPEEFYAQAHVFVLPSDEEGMPNSLLEAMAAGLPCAASDLPSTRGIVEQDVSGILFPRGDEAALAANIDRLLSSEELRRKLGRGARARVQDWSSSALLGRYTDLYRRLVPGAPGLKEGGLSCAE